MEWKWMEGEGNTGMETGKPQHRLRHRAGCLKVMPYQHGRHVAYRCWRSLKTWLENNVGKVMKGSLTRKAMEYTLGQWSHLVGYREAG